MPNPIDEEVIVEPEAVESDEETTTDEEDDEDSTSEEEYEIDDHEEEEGATGGPPITPVKMDEYGVTVYNRADGDISRAGMIEGLNLYMRENVSPTDGGARIEHAVSRSVFSVDTFGMAAENPTAIIQAQPNQPYGFDYNTWTESESGPAQMSDADNREIEEYRRRQFAPARLVAREGLVVPPETVMDENVERAFTWTIVTTKKTTKTTVKAKFDVETGKIVKEIEEEILEEIIEEIVNVKVKVG